MPVNLIFHHCCLYKSFKTTWGPGCSQRLALPPASSTNQIKDVQTSNPGYSLLAEGPYYLPSSLLLRSNITEGQPGVPLALRVLVEDPDCKPLPGTIVDVWQVNSTGYYSGYSFSGAGERAHAHMRVYAECFEAGWSCVCPEEGESMWRVCACDCQCVFVSMRVGVCSCAHSCTCLPAPLASGANWKSIR